MKFSIPLFTLKHHKLHPLYIHYTHTITLINPKWQIVFLLHNKISISFPCNLLCLQPYAYEFLRSLGCCVCECNILQRSTQLNSIIKYLLVFVIRNLICGITGILWTTPTTMSIRSAYIEVWFTAITFTFSPYRFLTVCWATPLASRYFC